MNRRKKSEFTARSCAYGLVFGEFNSIPRNLARKLVRLIARVSERSYRRGFQHGVEIGHKRTVDPFEFRYKRSLERSPFTDSGQYTSSIERLIMEEGELRMVGLDR